VVISGSEKHTTNNRMELLGLIAGLGYVAEEIKLYPSTKILVYTDSKYIENSINCKWLDKWVKKGWNNIKIKNVDLWIQVYKLLKLLNPEIQWVNGHSGVPGN
jgi:ribonuclease HI